MTLARAKSGDLRNQPPVDEPVQRPDRLSQTLLAKHDACPHDAYLYLKHGGGAPSHDMHRGSLFHSFAERAMWTLIENEERSLASVAEAEDPMQANAQVAALTETIVDECARDMDPEPPAADVDDVREMAFHWAVGNDVDPESVVGVEMRMELDVAGWTVVGRIDLVSSGGDVLQVDDYKTSFDMGSQEEVERRFQLWLYGAAVAFGFPTRKEICETCDGTGFAPTRPDGSAEDCLVCDGRQFVNVRQDPIGAGVNYFRLREVYPRYLDKDTGTLRYRAFVVSRTQLHNFLVDLTRAVEKIAGRFDSQEWPAVPGSHCARCTASALCPIPATFRDHAGEIETVEQASEALAKVEVEAKRHAAIKREVRNFAKARGVRVPVGTDLVYEFGEEAKTVTDYEGLEEAVRQAVDFGEPFDMARFRQRKTSTAFRRRKLAPGEAA